MRIIHCWKKTKTAYTVYQLNRFGSPISAYWPASVVKINNCMVKQFRVYENCMLWILIRRFEPLRHLYPMPVGIIEHSLWYTDGLWATKRLNPTRLRLFYSTRTKLSWVILFFLSVVFEWCMCRLLYGKRVLFEVLISAADTLLVMCLRLPTRGQYTKVL